MKLLFSFLVFSCCTQAGLAQITHLIQSRALAEDRSINIQLPQEYNNTFDSYGVLYVLDGEYVYDYAAGTVNFLSNAFGHIPPLIVVGIPNIDRLRDVYVTNDDKDPYAKFLEFIESELKPFIDSNYRTNGFDIIYGWSSASDISMQFFVTKPDLFDAHIQSGTGVGPKTAAFFSEQLSKHNYKNRYLYAGTEGSGPRAVGLEKYKNLIDSLSPKNLKWKFELISSSHVDVLAEGIYNGLKFVFNDFYIPDSVVLKGVEEIKGYYADLDKAYDFQVKIPVGAFGESAGILFQSKPGEAVNLLKYGLTIHPDSADLHGSLGEVYEYLDQTELAIKYYKLAFEKSVPKSAASRKYQYLSKKFEDQN
ncbi:MAG: alpha/beta hydrolase-fold protein [Reichenbachiella sp.]|uniref:alpha/beta hydrolase n=1 Tax=Reichenbachiella sp. TaxID=2184521 RepID=UPI002965F22C|nr:alpha/beta hydrolase-fold protein [Reichenbachiella sp.]MDW3208616.1 alpha/beta hydrolase-fold protein [Reichenbachiella sp.]